jgi:hypothetical protein
MQGLEANLKSKRVSPHPNQASKHFKDATRKWI